MYVRFLAFLTWPATLPSTVQSRSLASRNSGPCVHSSASDQILLPELVRRRMGGRRRSAGRHRAVARRGRVDEGGPVADVVVLRGEARAGQSQRGNEGEKPIRAIAPCRCKAGCRRLEIVEEGVVSRRPAQAADHFAQGEHSPCSSRAAT